MSKIFVIAGNRAEADYWIKGNLEKRKNDGETTLSWSDYVVVTDATRLRGYNEPHGVFIGTWRQRKDMEEIFQTLLTNYSTTQQSHRHINQLWGEWRESNPKPTPKLKPVAGGWINEQAVIDHAAAMMANEIDQQVLQNLSMKSAMTYEQLAPTLISAIQELKDEINRMKP